MLVEAFVRLQIEADLDEDLARNRCNGEAADAVGL